MGTDVLFLKYSVNWRFKTIFPIRVVPLIGYVNWQRLLSLVYTQLCNNYSDFLKDLFMNHFF